MAKQLVHQKDTVEKENRFAPVQKPRSRIFGAETECDIVAIIASRDGIPLHWVSVVIAGAISAPNDIKHLLN